MANTPHDLAGSASNLIPQRLLTVGAVADLLSVKPGTVYRLTALGVLPHLRVGRAVRYQGQAIAAYLDRITCGGEVRP